jgi:hypothetical protein
MRAILRKSFTSCDAFAALPPTLRINKQPWRSRMETTAGTAIDGMAVEQIRNVVNPPVGYR